MTLQNLLGIQRLQQHEADSASVLKLLGSAQRNLADARVDAIGNDNRFDAAYKCIMQCAMLGLWANGYRTATSQPGHHQTAIARSLCASLACSASSGLDPCVAGNAKADSLDALFVAGEGALAL